MGSTAVSVALFTLLVAIALRVVFSLNKDLYRVGAWGELGRKALPFAALAVMVITLPLVQNATAEWVPVTWAVLLGTAILLANFYSVPSGERRASRAFRKGDYEGAAEGFREMTEQKPLARYYAFLGAALGARTEDSDEEPRDRAPGAISGSLQESIDASTKAVELDPDYGVAYYNRALVLRKSGRKSRAQKDLKRALDADLPRRFRSAAKRFLEEG
ncbi:MAG: tetratricopeptide repeat protein [Rubrobacter sp.]|nr:tetratricopeptide repeat protein [Rubrobacter sp.]